ncbi:class I SAM-dependent methyltransferase [Desulforamulus hydrothermalis]|uniref:Class I SAM-dependent methyltransferase n=1 Tax=Desulforamulus hydrothermalis Lam5 = DSM 18033 TaxID=1121428 RepID=K8E7C6_9FIRM|nr:class I SAM-dependent methyltransferase [Desulforamulus hydrothermalis]CCO07383.1 conserved hypothetical protein [Desulforamulus hydrothermalis Lam5 = DSM 18033]SHH41483.1 Methyltransferase domain-containing protein [Desulforamulus hydrothermalis Lam5 = DSM 18033]
MKNGQIIFLDYPVKPQPRYGYGKPPHPELTTVISRSEPVYRQYLKSFLPYQEAFSRIPQIPPGPGNPEPAWINGWLPGLDALALYGMLALHNPRRYIEIGSGNSTKFARRAIKDQGLRTSITSVDPQPRAEIDAICDQVVRQPVEDTDLTLFQDLAAGDVLFVDHSHRAFTNTDATVVFLEILPRLKPGVLVEFHDILLPFDYPPVWGQRFYNEQYLLACYLLAEGGKFEIILPNYYISCQPELNDILAPIWQDTAMNGVETHGSSFWIKIK